MIPSTINTQSDDYTHVCIRINSTVPEQRHQGTPQWCEEGLLYAGQTQVLIAGCVQTLEGEQTERQELV